MAQFEPLRILTYNVHRCVGTDGRLVPARIARAVAEAAPDVVALQELDVNRPRTGRTNQATLIADWLHMGSFFFPAHQYEDEHFGNAILTRLPATLRKAAHLPGLPNYPHRERRAAVCVTITWNDCDIQVVNTHLGLSPRERILQAQALLSDDWLGDAAFQAPHVLCGDLNALPGTRAFRRLRKHLRDPFPWSSWPPGTFPSTCPLLRLDHVLFSRHWTIQRVAVIRSRLTRVASDHLPLLVEASLTA